MTEAEFEARVRRLEALGRHHPARYQATVTAMAVLGWIVLHVAAALAIVVGVGVALLGLTILDPSGFQALAVAAAFAALVLRVTWRRFEPLRGRRIRRDEAPILYGLVERVAAALGAPRVRDVRLVEDVGAASVLRPRWGLVGAGREAVLVGLPLLHALSVRELEAVLAHEIAHVSEKHLQPWIVRLRRALHELGQDEKFRGVLGPFLRWYCPRFDAWSGVLARAQEHEADAVAARLVGAEAMAQALLRTKLAALVLERDTWPRWRQLLANSEPFGGGPFAGMAGTLRGATWDAADLLDAAMAERTSPADAHPSLRRRLEALGERAVLLGRDEPAAAGTMLGASLPALTAELDRAWIRRHVETWHGRIAAARASRRELARLEGRARSAPLGPTETFQRATLTERVRGPAEALPMLEEAVRSPDAHPGTRLALGRVLLERGRDEGLAHLEAAAMAGPGFALPAAEIAESFLRGRGRLDEAKTWARRRWETLVELREADVERASLPLERASYERAELDPGDRARLVATLRGIPDLKRAWLVRRRVRVLPKLPALVLGIEPRRWLASERDLTLTAAVSRAVELPGTLRVILLRGHRAALKRLLRDVAGTPLVG